ncbi:MAG TPA: hypothetical protein VHV57_01295 [Acidimicrobiales bacterium]|jgi:alkylhydroperoxidase family enzyme|nr:hypothetical protein [Acidimicrobiales bacterium]
MPRIEPIPFEDLSEDTLRRIEAGTATGMYSTPVPLQILAHSPLAVRALDDGYKAHFRTGSLEPRLQELLRLRSSQLNACQPCSASRKEETVSEQDVACLDDPEAGRYTRREGLALRFLDLFATDHHAITDDTFAQLGQEFTTEQVVELGWLCAQSLGIHRLMHTLDVLGTGPAVLH